MEVVKLSPDSYVYATEWLADIWGGPDIRFEYGQWGEWIDFRVTLFF